MRALITERNRHPIADRNHPYQDGSFHYELPASELPLPQEAAVISFFTKLFGRANAVAQAYPKAGACGVFYLYYPDRNLFIANAGDCFCVEIILQKKPTADALEIVRFRPLNNMHDMYLEKELMRIIQSKDVVHPPYLKGYRGIQPSLQMTRCIGNHAFKEQSESFTHEPEMYHYRLSPLEKGQIRVILSSSDGILNDNQQGMSRISYSLEEFIKKIHYIPNSTPQYLNKFLATQFCALAKNDQLQDDMNVSIFCTEDARETLPDEKKRTDLGFFGSTYDGHGKFAEKLVEELLLGCNPESLRNLPQAASENRLKMSAPLPDFIYNPVSGQFQTSPPAQEKPDDTDLKDRLLEACQQITFCFCIPLFAKPFIEASGDSSKDLLALLKKIVLLESRPLDNLINQINPQSSHFLSFLRSLKPERPLNEIEKQNFKQTTIDVLNLWIKVLHNPSQLAIAETKGLSRS